MPQNAKARNLLFVVFMIIVPGVLLPSLQRSHLPDVARGGITGLFIGLAIIGLFCMTKSNRRSSSDG